MRLSFLPYRKTGVVVYNPWARSQGQVRCSSINLSKEAVLSKPTFDQMQQEVLKRKRLTAGRWNRLNSVEGMKTYGQSHPNLKVKLCD